MRTFDGRAFNVEALGVFTMVESGPLTVQVGTRNLTAQAFVVEALAVRFGTTVYTVTAQGLVKVSATSTGVTVNQTQSNWSFQMSDGSRVAVGKSGLGLDVVSVNLPASAKTKVKGLCGNFDGNSQNDNISPGLYVIANAKDLGISWIPPDSQNLFSCGVNCDQVKKFAYDASISGPVKPGPGPSSEIAHLPGEQACNRYLLNRNVPYVSGSARLIAPIEDATRLEACQDAADTNAAAMRIWCLAASFAQNVNPNTAAYNCHHGQGPKFTGGAPPTWPPSDPAPWQSVPPKTPPATPPTTTSSTCDTAKENTCQDLLQDQILWNLHDIRNPASKHWAVPNLQRLCKCTSSPPTTVNCFQNALYNNGQNRTWADAIEICRAH